MRAAAALIVVLALAAQSAPRWYERTGYRNRSSRGGSSGTVASMLFEFASSSGVGAGAACACSTVTGLLGEVMTFTRSGSAYCPRRGYATTGLVDGDLVLCSANQPRVVATSDGGLGLLVEGTATNILTQPRDIGAWTPFNYTVASTITPDAGTRIDGSSGGWRVDMPACTGGTDVAQIYLPTTFPSGAVTCTGYFKGAGVGGTTYMWIHDGAADVAGAACTFVDGQWTRCSTTHTFASGVTGAIIFGNNRWGAGGITAPTDATSFIVDALQCEAGSTASSFYTGARTAETPYLTMATALEGDKSWSVSARFERPAVTSTPATTFIPLELMKPSTYNLIRVDRVSNTAQMYAFIYGAVMPSGSAGTIAYTPALTASTKATVVSLRYDHATAKVRTRVDGTNSSEGALTNTPHTGHEMTHVYVGFSPNYSLHGNGIVSSVCVDQTATGCWR